MLKQETQTQLMLTNLRTRLLVMCAATSIAVDEAVEALAEGSIGRAAAVIEGDSVIDSLETEIDNLAMAFLVRNQPMASDLRFVVGALRMVNDLERIGDEAVVIAERITSSQGQGHAEMTAMTKKLTELARCLLSRSVAAFREGDADLALSICRLEEEVAQEEVSVMQRIMTQASAASPDFDAYTAMHSLLLCRALNRICRRSVNMAEHTYFIAKGTLIKHNRHV